MIKLIEAPETYTTSALTVMNEFDYSIPFLKQNSFKQYYTWIQSRERTNRSKKRRRK